MADGRKILFYIHGLTGGGAERVWALLASGFAAQGFDIMLATDFAAVENVAYLNPFVRQIVLGGSHLANIWRLSRLMRRESPDVIVSALSASNLKVTIAALLAGKLRRTIISYHGYTDTEPQPLSRLGYAATPLLSRMTAATVCVSDGLRDYVVSRWKALAERTTRIYNPVVVSGAPATSEAELLARPPTVLASGRLIHYKNFPSLIRAFQHVEPADARLHLLGEGPELANIKEEVDRLGLSDRVSLLGYQSQPWPHYQSARCFVLPSSKEPFGLVVVEALAHGLPVVATDCDGPREILTNTIGQVVGIDDELALARCISKALANPGDPQPRISHARKFSLETALAAYGQLFAEVTRRATAKPGSPVVTISSG